MWIFTQISSYLVSSEMWEVGSAALPHLPPLSQPARDALEIERRSRKGVNLRNESRRYSLCCERMQGIVRVLALGGAPIHEPFVWRAYDAAGEAPRALAWLALSEYLRRFYEVDRNGIKRDRLRYDRLEAVFHPPGIRVSNLLALFEQIRRNPHLGQVFTAASQKAEVANPTLHVTPEECGSAFEHRYRLIKRCADKALAMVDLIDSV
jgi:hypothetical protein